MAPHRALAVAAGSFLAVLVFGCFPSGIVVGALIAYPLAADFASFVLWQALPTLALTVFAFAAPLAAAEADDERDAQVAAGALPVHLGPGWRIVRSVFALVTLPAIVLGAAAALRPSHSHLPSLGALLFLGIVGFWVTVRRRQPVALWPDRIVDGAGRTHAFATLTRYFVLRRRGGGEQHTLTFPTGTVRWEARVLEQPQWLASEVAQRAAAFGHGAAR